MGPLLVDVTYVLNQRATIELWLHGAENVGASHRPRRALDIVSNEA